MPNSRLNSAETPPIECGELQLDRAASIAYEMAYGLSHELNNPLANIAGRARLLAEQETDPDKRQQLAIIVDQAMRGCEMIADLMLFARPPQWNAEEVDIGQLLAELIASVERLARPRAIRIQLETSRSAAGIVTVQADRLALMEAFGAVLRNAIEVAQSFVDVDISIDTNQLCIGVRDDGPGLTDHALAHAFHPYFSGREAGRGLGLGLSKARRIFGLCDGSINLSNVDPRGCQVNILLPMVSHAG